jgi:hypothetical protein
MGSLHEFGRDSCNESWCDLSAGVHIDSVAMSDQATPQAKFLTPKQLAARWQCSEMKLRRMRRAGILSVHYIGRSARYPIECVERVELDAKA